MFNTCLQIIKLYLCMCAFVGMSLCMIACTMYMRTCVLWEKRTIETEAEAEREKYKERERKRERKWKRDRQTDRYWGELWVKISVADETLGHRGGWPNWVSVAMNAESGRSFFLRSQSHSLPRASDVTFALQRTRIIQRRWNSKDTRMTWLFKRFCGRLCKRV